MDLARPVDAVDQHSRTQGQEAPDGHRVGDPSEVTERLLAESPVALLVEPVESEGQKSDEREREVVGEVVPEALERVRRLWRHLREKERGRLRERRKGR